MSGHPDTGGGNSPGDAGFDGMADLPGGMFETDDRDSITGRDPMISDYSNQTAIVAKAADLVTTAIKEIRKATLIEDFVFERLTASSRDMRGDLVEGSIRFAMKARGGMPPKRSRIWIDVPVTGGYMHPPASFQDSSGRSYALSREAIRELVGAGYTDPPKMTKKFPTAELSLTDRTVLPTAPARNFFSLASRREARAEQYNVKWYSKGYDGNERPMDDSYSSSFDADGMNDAMQMACGLGATAFPGTNGWRPTEDGEIADADGNYSGVVYKTFEIDHPDHFSQLAATEEATMKKEVPGGPPEVTEDFNWGND